MARKQKSSKKAERGFRICATCRKPAPIDDLLRWVLTPEGEPFVDLKGRFPGRGSYFHPQPDCLKGLIPALARSQKRSVHAEFAVLMEQLESAARTRAHGLLGLGKRSGALVFGADEVDARWKQGKLAGIVVATDARSAAKATSVLQAIPEGRAMAFSTKAELGAGLGAHEIGVLGIAQEPLAKSVFGAIAMALLGADLKSFPASSKNGDGNFGKPSGISEVE